jgi:hypothetical protein
MGKRQTPDQVKLFIGLLTRFVHLGTSVKDRLVECFGPIDLESAAIPFGYTDYYANEMGDGLFKVLFSFQNLVGPDELSRHKCLTDKIEAEFKSREISVPRPVNLDPGYLELSKLVLASTKNFYHRIYLKDGIYAEITLYYQDKKFRALPWTFPDYQSEAYQTFFQQVRQRYAEQLRRR